MGTHEQCLGATDEWYTPPEVFAALGCSQEICPKCAGYGAFYSICECGTGRAPLFDLDVSSPGHGVTPWLPAKEFYTSEGLAKPWAGFVWMNPPFGGRNGLVPWLQKFVEHGNGIALVPDRTSAPWWQEFDPQMDLTFFVSKKIKFIDGRTMKRGKSPAQGTTLWSMGTIGADALRQAEASGFGVLHTAAKAF